MNLISTLSLAVLLITVVGVYYLDATASATAKENASPAELFQYTPPYYFQPNDLVSNLTAFAFAFLFSLLFFGFSGVITGAIEGLKFGSILSSILFTTTNTYGYIDILFIIPQILAILAASTLGQGVINDYHSRGNMADELKTTAKYLAIGLILTIAFYVIKTNTGA